MYEALAAALLAITGLPGAEYEWATRPVGNHLTVQLDFSAQDDNGDDHHQDTSWEGSVDLYTVGKAWDVAAQVEEVLTAHCEGAWEMNSMQYDRETGLIHREYVFQLEEL